MLYVNAPPVIFDTVITVNAVPPSCVISQWQIYVVVAALEPSAALAEVVPVLVAVFKVPPRHEPGGLACWALTVVPISARNTNATATLKITFSLIAALQELL
jgi:hypothetical protein